MTTQYVDAFYWEYGYAEGDINLQIIEATPSNVAATAQGGLGSVKTLFAQVSYSSGALVGGFALNSVCPAALPEASADVIASASLEVVRLIPVAGAMSVSASSSAELDKTISFVGDLQGAANTAAAVALSVPLSAGVTCTVTTQANLSQLVNMVSAVNAQVTVAPAALNLSKPFVASGDAFVNTIAVALLGKRLGGLGSAACVVTAANSAIGKAMASSLAVVTSAAATAQVNKPFAADAPVVASAQPVLALGKPIKASVLAAVASRGSAVLLRFVPAEIADRATYTLSYSPIYVDAVLSEETVAEVVSPITATVSDTTLALDIGYTTLYVEAELVEEIGLEAHW
jgi:hypothetical protein